MKRKASICCMTGCGFVVAAAVAVWISSRPKSLLDYATPVANTFDWAPGTARNRPYLQFCWLSPTEVLYARSEDGLRMRLMRKRIDRRAEPPVQLPLTVPAWSVNWQVSPDGRSLSWLELPQSPPWTPLSMSQIRCVEATLDGTRIRSIQPRELHTAWSADSKSVLSIISSTTGRPGGPLALRSPLSSGKPEQIPLSRPATWIDGSMPAPGPLIALHHFPDGRLRIVKNGLFIIRPPAGQTGGAANTNGLDFADYDLNHPSLPPQTWKAKPPPDIDYGSAIVSPQGDRLFWQAGKTTVSPLEDLIHRAFPSFKVHPQRFAKLFVSDIRGNGMHEIAAYRTQAVSQRTPGVSSPPQWTPDGKNISFAMNGKLYTVPAD